MFEGKLKKVLEMMNGQKLSVEKRVLDFFNKNILPDKLIKQGKYKILHIYVQKLGVLPFIFLSFIIYYYNFFIQNIFN